MWLPEGVKGLHSQARGEGTNSQNCLLLVEPMTDHVVISEVDVLLYVVLSEADMRT
jgi:hypothetical protein